MDLFGSILIVLTIVVTLALICTLVGFDVVDYFRRRKHPKWYEYFDRATKNSFFIGSRLKDDTANINKCIAAMQEAYKNGELTENAFRGMMRLYTNDYIKVVKQYNTEFEALGIDADLKAADTYARERDFKWGILYED